VDRTAEFGTIVIGASLKDTPFQKIYGTYKLRWEIERMFDSMRKAVKMIEIINQSNGHWEAS
jgi:hypothetical protein